MDIDQPKEIFEKLLKFNDQPKGIMLLAGPPGTGKTFASKEIYHSHTPYKLPHHDWDKAIYINQTDLNLRWYKEFKQFNDTSYLLLKLSEVPLLVIDDLGSRNPSDSFLDFLYSLFDKRYENRKTHGTIITTNFNALTLRDSFGDRIFSRITCGEIIKFNGKDRRMKDF